LEVLSCVAAEIGVTEIFRSFFQKISVKLRSGEQMRRLVKASCREPGSKVKATGSALQ
jgi:hypothetical protein